MSSGRQAANKQQTVNTINTSNNIYSYLHMYMFHLLFCVLRPVKIKYTLSVNLLLVINDCYLYTKLYNTDLFFMSQIIKFNKYYDYKRMSVYFRILEQRSLIIRQNKIRNGYTFKLSPDCINIINEIEESYQGNMYSLLSKYNIVL